MTDEVVEQGTDEPEKQVDIEALLAELDTLRKKTAVHDKRNKRITKIEDRLEKSQQRVRESDAAHKEAAAQLKADKSERDKITIELQQAIRDVKNGQDQLPHTEETDEDAPPAEVAQPGTAENWPISELGTKRIKALIGNDAFYAAKTSENPVGLSDNQLEKLEAAEWNTIADLEKAMREVRDWWLPLAKSMDAQIVTRVQDTVVAFRTVNPMPDSEGKTVVQKLAEANEAAAVEGDQPIAMETAETLA